MPLGVFDNRRRVIEPHRLIVEQSRRKRRQIMTLEISAGIGDQGTTGGVRLGKPIERKRGDGKNNLLLGCRRDAIALHTFPQLYLDVAHALFAAFKTKSPAQFFRLPTTEAGS